MFQKRIDKLKQTIKEKNLDGLLVSNFYNILYLTGFKTLTENEREAFCLVTNNNTYLMTDKRYIDTKIKNQNSKIKINLTTPKKKLIQHIQEITKDEKIRRLGIEEENLRVGEFNLLKEKLHRVELISTNQLIIILREIKEVEEIKKIKKACEISDQCLKEIIKTISIGQTEKEIAWKIERWLKEKCYDTAFDPIVAIDKNSSIPHYLTKEGTACVRRGSIILIDFGVKHKDYCSDITRMIFMSRPKQEIINTYNKLLSIQKKTINRLNAIKFLKEIDADCRLQIIDNRLPLYPHSTGHGIGLEVHEYPKVSINSQDQLEANQVFTIEPGIYFQGKWGLRIEDTVYVNNNHEIEILTKFPKMINYKSTNE